ncbi:biopolymer transport protein ExbB [Ereboglobus sp. PH5-5]|uniref:MotA/TolQ/ExbB proton channel family protein n=2 Tax=unclassified Ereboglobus TaxID=2626932 RepID=UPI002404C552|nr:MotA/TolQ/ExbB proton channel family protein [Ereboglobus sp. PH5-5]MDF9827883.1 biopolymer transport protein ExbB [Ereboglobus sp. PH5-10]MDF9833459.1 biopolymer transport protein ExbB [Ereboglobus sp. PH5-5]
MLMTTLLSAIDGMRIIKEAGLLAYPLGFCSVAAIFIICERSIALRESAIIPIDLADSVLGGQNIVSGVHSALGRIIGFVERHPGDMEGAKAYARLEVMKMERGVSYLDVIYTGAPLIGLIGTVSGLLAAFSKIDPVTKMPDPVQFTESVGYALSATLLGLVVAVIALIGNGYLQRRIDAQAAKLDVLLERVLQYRKTDGGDASGGNQLTKSA